MDFDLELDFDSEGIEKIASDFTYNNGVPYLKKDLNLGKDQELFVTYLRIYEVTNKQIGKSKTRFDKLIDTIGRNKNNGYLPRKKVEGRVRNMIENHGREWYIVEEGIIVDLFD
jgi:hypothetical protein